MSQKDQFKQLRDQIDKIDDQLLALLNERAGCALAIGAVKETTVGAMVYRPEREAQILRRVVKATTGPLTATQITGIYREIISACRSGEEKPKVAVLGPVGTYSETAAVKHFGQEVAIEFETGIEEVFRSVENGDVHYGVVPVENSTEGGVAITLDCLVITPLHICGEIDLRIRHALIGREVETRGPVKVVRAHPQALAQCRKWLDRHLPHAERVPVTSNAAAVNEVAQGVHSVAIASAETAEHYGLAVLHRNIEDQVGNTTRFLIVGPQRVAGSGYDKTSLVLSAHGRDAPGALQRLLGPLATHEINMTSLQSRPSKTGLWEYVFFVDFEGHQEEALVSQALADIQKESALFKVLGSYPRSL